VIPVLAVILFFVFQAAVTWWLWRSEIYVRSEKLAQTKLIWLLPFLGAVLVLVMLLEETVHRG
jgi:hypothetical protein